MATRRPSRKRQPRSIARREQPGRAVPRMWVSLLLVLTLAAGAWWAYSTSFAGVFVFDDKWAIADNPHIKTLWPLTTSMSAPAEAPVSARPIAALSLAINYALAPADARDVLRTSGPGLPPGAPELFLRNVWGYHAMNLALHLLAALALLGVVRRTLLSGRLRAQLGEHATPLALAVALLWLVHPMLTDAVTYVAQRTEGLMGLFYFLTLYCAIRAGERGVSTGGGRWWTVGAVLACALGMGSKQTMVFAPVIVWLWDRTFGPQPPAGTPDAAPRWVFAPPGRRGLYAGLATTWVILAALVAYERWPTSVGSGIEGWTPWTYLLTETGVIAHYLRLAVFPSPLVLDYDGWPMARSILDVWPAAAILAAFLAATLIGVVRRQAWGFVGAWFLAALAPSSSLLPLPTEIAAERRMYLPLAALAVAAVVCGYVIGRWALRRFVPGERARRLAGGIAAVLVVGAAAAWFATLASERNRVFWSEERLWQDTVEKRPDNPRARLNYGVILYTLQRFQEAEPQLREAVRLKDTSAPAHANLGAVLCALGKVEEGVSHLERGLALDPTYSAAYGNLGEAYGQLGRRGSAATYFARAVEAAPDAPFLLNRLGWLLATSPEDGIRNGAKAVEVSERAARLTSRQDTMSLDTLAAAYAEVGRFDEAAATAREVLALAERQGRQDELPGLSARLALYQARRPFREPR
jgi:protein O-mannosyl-transferase